MKKLLYILFIITTFQNALSQSLEVDLGLSNDSLAKLLTGDGISISNVWVDCADSGYGKYLSIENMDTIAGLVLTTGNDINDILGPNNMGNFSSYSTPENLPQLPILSQLEGISGRKIYEYCKFEFDIIPSGDSLSFDYVFASEEYEEWVGSQFNDIFGFFISGPGITPDPGIAPLKNIALIPDTDLPVAINTVNQINNSQYYVATPSDDPLMQYDGRTTRLTAFTKVIPCQTYHMILAVADASDKLWDSGVFIDQIKSNPKVSVTASTVSGTPNMSRSCNDGIFTFTRSEVTDQALEVKFYITGTQYDELTPQSIIIPENEASVELYIDSNNDLLIDTKNVNVYIGNPYCENELFIIDHAELGVIKELKILDPDSVKVIDVSCYGDENGAIDILIEKTSEYEIKWSTGEKTSSINSLKAGFYSVTITNDNGCDLTNEFEVKSPDHLTLDFLCSPPSCHNYSDGTITVIPKGGTPTYQYYFNGKRSDSGTFNMLTSGFYSFKVTDSNNCETYNCKFLEQPQPLYAEITNIIEESCIGSCDGQVEFVIHGGNEPYDHMMKNSSFESYSDSTLCHGEYTLIVNDSNGCSYSMPLHIDYIQEKCKSDQDCNITCPTGFSPNEDGINDFYEIIGCDEHVFKIKIFNKWGEQIFSSNDYKNNWDGSLTNGNKCSEGHYFIVVECTELDYRKKFFVYLKK